MYKRQPIRRVIEKPKEVKKEDSIKETTIEKINEVVDEKGIVFKVQLSASGKKLDLTPSNFKGLKNITSSYNNGCLLYTSRCV